MKASKASVEKKKLFFSKCKHHFLTDKFSIFPASIYFNNCDAKLMLIS